MAEPIKPSRRGFLRGLSAAPLLVRQAAEQATAMVTAESYAGSLLGGGPPSAGGLRRALFGAQPWYKRLLSALVQGGIPDYRKRQLQRDAVYMARRLDPDVACLNSTSLGHRIRKQQNISMARLLEAEIDRLKEHDEGAAWEEKWGVRGDDYYGGY